MGFGNDYKTAHRATARAVKAFNDLTRRGYSKETAIDTIKKLKIDGKKRFKKSWSLFFGDVKF